MPVSARSFDPRKLRNKLADVSQQVQDIRGPFDEGFERAPVIVIESFDALQTLLDEFDRALAKLDGQSGAVPSLPASRPKEGNGGG